MGFNIGKVALGAVQGFALGGPAGAFGLGTLTT